MSGLAATMRLELRLQQRYGFLYAAVFSAAVWLAILLPIPAGYRDVAAPLVLFGDLLIVAFFFIAGSLFFEKGERTLFALVVTPLRFGAYIVAKLVTLTALTVVLSFAIILPVHGVGFDVPLVLLGAVTGALVMLLVSFSSAVPYVSITDWVLPSTFWLGLLNVPLIHYSGLWEHPVLYLIPTQGPLLMFGAAFGQIELTGAQLAACVLVPLVWTGVLLVIARRVFQRYIVAGEGT
ncbi:fluoroquinolone transporter permease [Nocardiopsis sediminis]|uniref:Fluoroquinolone transporter permease n=1 Tax=Nocardiopsis sediminis TaxID=1778267 RepID=A0ABV8FUE2_9ACTN